MTCVRWVAHRFLQGKIKDERCDFKVWCVEGNWFEEGGQKDDWTTALRFTVWESGSDEMKKRMSD